METLTPYAQLTCVLGILLLFSWAQRLWSFLFLHFFHSSTIASYLSRDASSTSLQNYALVTGASDGIGLGFVHELIVLGFNVIIHGRNPVKLRTIQAQLQQQYPDRNIKIWIVDASNQPSWAEAFSFLLATLEESNAALKVLVNNVGGSASPHVAFNRTLNRLVDATTALTNVNATFPAGCHARLVARLG